MKKKTKLFSLVLSLILIMVSVPMSVYSEEINQVENSEQITENGFEDVSLEDNFLNIEENVYSATSSTTSTSEEITILPDGIYAFQLKGSNMFMKSENAYPESGDNMTMTQYTGTSVPYLRGSPVATFKITRRESSGTYIIRLMTDESLTIAFDGTNVVTKSISTIDAIVALRNTFYITKHSDGYSIRPYSSTDYIVATSDNSDVTSGTISDNSKWYLRGYRTFLEEGVYAFENVHNTGMWMDTQQNSYSINKNAQQYNYTSSPADSFSRGGLFKVTKTDIDGQYVIRLMTNNLLTWEIQSDNYVKSDYISYDEDDIEANQKYYIVFDAIGFLLVPSNNVNKVISALNGSTASGTEGGDDARLRAVQRSGVSNSARWKLHKYTGEDDGYATLIVPDAFEDTGAIVGNSYTVTPIFWHTDPDKNRYAITDNGNVSNISIDTVNHTVNIYVHDPGKLALEVDIQYLVLGIPINNIEDCFNYDYNAVPKEGVYYLRNSYSKKYADILGPSHAEGQIIHQWEYHTSPQAKWQVEHVSGESGYVRFKSLYSNLYMGVDPNDSSQIRQYSTTGDNTLWRFEALDNCTVKIICKVSESSGTVLATPADRDGNGEWLTQRAYTDDDNRSDEWNIIAITDYDAFLLGITDNSGGHDHSSCYDVIEPDLIELGYNNINIISSNNIDCEDVLDIISQSRMFVFRGHGGSVFVPLKQKEENEILSPNETLGAADFYNFSTETIVMDLTNYDFMLFVGCETAVHSQSLPYAAVKAGAEYAIGFKDSIGCLSANRWTITFFGKLAEGYSISDAAKLASEQCDYTTDIGSYVVVYKKRGRLVTITKEQEDT